VSEPFLAEIRMVGFNFAPRGWAMCDGQILPINQNQALYSLVGISYGGNGSTTFGLPDLRGRTPVHAGFAGGVLLGQSGGEEAHALTTSELPSHTHTLLASGDQGSDDSPAGNAPASKPRRSTSQYTTPNPSLVPMAATQIGNTGGSQPHNNMQPCIALNFVIALQGVFPSRS
jgi:microcystin-dependent protein